MTDLIPRDAAAAVCDKHSYSNNPYVSGRMADPRDEVIARLVDAMHTISGDIQINADGEEELSDAARIARAALAAAKAAQHG